MPFYGCEIATRFSSETAQTRSSMSTIVRTSHTHPLRIATIEIGSLGGAIGVTFAPGKHQAAAMTGVWKRDLALDLEAIRQWGAHHLVSLLEPHEFTELAIPDLPKQALKHGLCWHGLPITDGEAPDARFLEPWSALERRFATGLTKGQRIVVHCKGGLGRAGTVACLLLLATGTDTQADEAMRRVRAVRKGAIETVVQEAFLRAWPTQHAEDAGGSRSIGQRD